MNEALDGINKATNNIGEKVKRQKGAIDLANQIKDPTKVFSRMKKIIKFVSDDLHKYSISLDKNIKTLSDSRNEGFDALSKSLIIFAESYPDELEQLETLEKQLKGLLEAKTPVFNSMDEFRSTIATLPKFTIQFNKSRREVIKSLEKFLTELDDIENTSTNLLDSIAELKARKTSPPLGE